MAEEAFSLKDAIALYSGKIDLSHKLWAYLQVVALAVMGFAWSTDRSALVLWALLAVFIVFALLNGLLLVGTQGEAVEIATAIKRYRTAYEKKEIKEELRPALDTLRPWAPWKVRLAHLGIDVLTIGAIVWQLWAKLRVHHGPVGWGEVW
jgi:hypothetical protein